MSAKSLRIPLGLIPALAMLCTALSPAASAGSLYRNGHYFGEEIELGTHSTSFDVRNRNIKKLYFVTEGTCTKVATGETLPEFFIGNDSLTPTMRISKKGKVNRTFEVVDNGRTLKVKLRLRLFGGYKGTVSIDVSSADTSTETCSATRKIDVRIGD